MSRCNNKTPVRTDTVKIMTSFLFLSLFVLHRPAFSETVVKFADGTTLHPDRPAEKYLQLDQCSVGNNKNICKEEKIKEVTDKAAELSKKKNDIVLITWMEEAEDATELASYGSP